MKSTKYDKDKDDGKMETYVDDNEYDRGTNMSEDDDDSVDA